MNRIFIKKALISVFCCLLVLIGVGCDSEREYYDDIHITLQDASEKLIIKEWSFLLGSGAEVYYQRNNEKPILLGKTTGGDDGFCPFKEGLYKIVQDGRLVRVKWCFNPSDKDMSNWQSKTFELPK